MTKTDSLKEILKITSGFPVLKKLSGKKIGFEIRMDYPASISYPQLLKLAEFFGTEWIDVNNDVEQHGGCETCAYDKVLLTIQVYEPTKNVPVFKKERWGTYGSLKD